MRHSSSFLARPLSETTIGRIVGRLSLSDYAGKEPQLQIERYFAGELEAWGVFQDRFSVIRRSFSARIDGRWDGHTLTLVEDFTFDDRTTEQRVWRLRKAGADRWRASANDVVGEAQGVVAGNALNLRYAFDLGPSGGRKLRVRFNDWMWLLDDRVMMSRGYVSKFGVGIGELTIFFQRKQPLP